MKDVDAGMKEELCKYYLYKYKTNDTIIPWPLGKWGLCYLDTQEKMRAQEYTLQRGAHSSSHTYTLATSLIICVESNRPILSWNSPR